MLLRIPTISDDTLKPCYRYLNDSKINKEFYKPVSEDSIYHNFGMPGDHHERYRWFSLLQICTR